MRYLKYIGLIFGFCAGLISMSTGVVMVHKNLSFLDSVVYSVRQVTPEIFLMEEWLAVGVVVIGVILSVICVAVFLDQANK